MDSNYLAKVYKAARLGHLEALVKLGDYAYRRGAVLCLQCEIDPWYARARLKELAERGVPEAQLFLGKGMK